MRYTTESLASLCTEEEGSLSTGQESPQCPALLRPVQPPSLQPVFPSSLRHTGHNHRWSGTRMRRDPYILSRSVWLSCNSPRSTDPPGWKTKLQYQRRYLNKIWITKYLPLSSVKLSIQNYIWLKNIISEGFKKKTGSWSLDAYSLEGCRLQETNLQSMSFWIKEETMKKIRCSNYKWSLHCFQQDCALYFSSTSFHPEFLVVGRHGAKRTWAHGLVSFDKGSGRMRFSQVPWDKVSAWERRSCLFPMRVQRLNTIPQDFQGGERSGYDSWVALLGSHVTAGLRVRK